MKKLFAVMLFAFSVSVMAAVEVDTRGLTDTQKAELVKQAEAMKQAAESPVAIEDKAEKWVNIGKQFGEMVGGAAKEIGIAANEFLKTPVGIMTAGLIVFHYAGGPIIHVALGTLILFVGIAVLSFCNRRWTGWKIEYDETKTNWFGNHPIKSKTRERTDGDTTTGILLGYLLILVVSVWTMFSW